MFFKHIFYEDGLHVNNRNRSFIIHLPSGVGFFGWQSIYAEPILETPDGS